MRKSFTAKYNYGDQVYLKTKPTDVRIVVGYIVRQKSVEYLTKQGDDEFCLRDTEIEKVKGGEFIVRGFKR